MTMCLCQLFQRASFTKKRVGPNDEARRHPAHANVTTSTAVDDCFVRIMVQPTTHPPSPRSRSRRSNEVILFEDHPVILSASYQVPQNDSSNLHGEPPARRSIDAKQKVKDPNNDERKKGVSFGTVSIRCYKQILGDNPACAEGAPLELGWSYYEGVCLSVDDFELARDIEHGNRCQCQPAEHQQHQKRRRTAHFRMSALQRHIRLLELGYSLQEIETAQKTVLRIRQQRASTVAKLQSPVGRLSDHVLERAESLLFLFPSKKRLSCF